ncbi:MAG: hypothetical protein EPN45_01825 [Rhizobiaceae bacterium]|nr:MAG: hypothetical protein EPN45_01825 [Rhizobiaceae bacterium]
MFFCAFLRMKDPELSALHRPEHLAYLARLERQESIFARGRFLDGSGGLVIYQAASEQEARQLAEADPLVQTGARELEFRAWEKTSSGDR